jgi:hypothetical protein
MLTIRPEQMNVMSEQLLQKFQVKMIAHLKELFPKRTAALGDENLVALVQEGMSKSKTYAIVAERDVAKFIDLMLIVRRDLDVAKETSWAKGILNDKSLNGSEKIGRLYASARRNRFKVNDELPVAAPAAVTPMPGARQAPMARPMAPRPQTTVRPPTTMGSVPPL